MRRFTYFFFFLLEYLLSINSHVSYTMHINEMHALISNTIPYLLKVKYELFISCCSIIHTGFFIYQFHLKIII